MKDRDKLEDIVRRDLDVRASDRTYDRLRDIVLNAHGPAGTTNSVETLTRKRRMILRNPIAKLAAAAVVVLAALILWHALGAVSSAYALSDVPGIIRQARTIHICTRTNDGKGRWEHWYDIENAREYVYHEGEYQVTFDSPETRRRAVATVRDGQYVMEVDHVQRTARFERWLPSEQELHRLRIADFAVNAALPDVLQYLDRYTKIGTGKIGEQSYDIWRREWKEPKSDFGIRYDIWVSPSTGEIGRTRQWINHNQPPLGWMLRSETDKIGINVEPPAGIFATEPPAGYVAENSKTTADLTSAGFGPHQSAEKYRLTVPASFMLEDGSVMACWNVAGGPTEPDPNQAYRDLTLGGPVPDLPVALYGLLSSPVLGAEKWYGSVSFWNENTAITMVHGIGRHLMCTHKAGRVYEWALYVPQKETPSHKLAQEIIVAVKGHARYLQGSPTIFMMDSLTSLVVTPERLAQYLAEAFSELSDNPAVPTWMSYPNLLDLAKQVRGKPGLYEDFAKEVKQEEERSIGGLQPVPVTAPDKVQ